MPPTIIRIEGPPGGFKSTITRHLITWANRKGFKVYVNEEDGTIEGGTSSKDEARLHIYTKQTN